MADAPSTFYVPLGDYIDGLWPRSILDPPPADLIDGVWIEPLRIETKPSFSIKTAMLFEKELSLAIPGIDGVSLVVAGAGHDSAFMFEFFSDPEAGMRVVDVPIAIRFAADLLKPATLVTLSDGRQAAQADPSRDIVDITLAKVTLTAEFDGDFGIDTEAGIDLPLCLIGDTGVGLEARNIRFVRAGDPPPPGRPEGWRGLHIPEASLYLPGDLGAAAGHLQLIDATIGNGGFSGTVADSWMPPLAASLGGMAVTLNAVTITFIQNCLTECVILGTIQLPFFDVPLEVEIGINLDGSFAVKLATDGGLIKVTKAGLLDLEVHSLGFAWAAGTFTITLSGKITPLAGGLDWPSFDVKALTIDSDGNVAIDGGWLDLRDGYALDFHGFQIEITKLGFGRTEDGGKWLGFSGAMKLVDEMAAGASVDGLRLTWYGGDLADPRITLDGVGVELLVPDAFAFKGLIGYREIADPSGETIHRFDGAIKLQFLALDLEIDGSLVVGTAPRAGGGRYTFAAIYLATELPAGIPLFSTGLALYGFAGLFALRMAPDKRPDEPWYGMGPAEGWYKRPSIGVTDLTGKWRPEDGALALGAGLTIGTLADNGFTFNARAVLVVSLPGPILMIEGRANLLKERAALSEEPLFRALAVLDGCAGTMLFGLDAQYKAGSGGELIDIHGSAEAFFDLADHDRWHVYLGLDEPREKRIRAELFKLFDANSYVMIDAHAVRLGAWAGYDKNWKYGPVKITLEAWLETNIAVNRKPIHFHGDLWAHGKFAMKVFGFGFSAGLDAKLAGDVFDPLHILAELSVELDLPWPIPNIDVDLTLEWGPELDPPPIPIVLKEVAIEHFKVTTAWPLPRGQLLLPNFDRGGFIGVATGPSVPGDLAGVPVVPLDARPHLTFGRPVHDAALVGINPQPPDPAWERIGDPAANQGPARVKFSLLSVSLEKQEGSVWTAVARKAQTANPPGVPELYGSWAPVPALGSASGAVSQVKLWLWSRTPFDYTRGTSGAWDEWFTGQFTSYPCIPEASSRHLCCDFTRYRLGDPIATPHVCDADMAMFGFPANHLRLQSLAPPVEGIDRGAAVLPEGSLFIQFAKPAARLDILLAPVADGAVLATVMLEGNIQLAPIPVAASRFDIMQDKVVAVRLSGRTTFTVIRVCADLMRDPQDVLDRTEMAQHLQAATAHWSETGAVLEPNTTYRLLIRTRAEAVGEDELSSWSDTREQDEIAYFRTEGPPGLGQLSLPLGRPAGAAFDSGLDDLARYVRQTVPATVPASGEKPLLPKPVYRAYDVGVAFNEDYVDLMYRLAGRDLGLYLFDNNGAPVRDAEGGVIVRPNAWGYQEEVTLDASETRWVQVVNASTCVVIDETATPADVTLAAASSAQVLAPSTLHEARLVPLLYRESFVALPLGATALGPAGTLGRWRVLDQGVSQGPSRWTIAETAAPVTRYVAQSSNIWGGTVDGDDPVKPGTMLILGPDPRLGAADAAQPAAWSDYRVTCWLRNADNDAVGIVFRYVDPDNYYRFSMDGERKYRRLVRVVSGVHTILAEDDRRYRSNVDYAITIEAAGDWLRVYVNGKAILDAHDNSHARGGIGLYCWAADGARFLDVAVDDLSGADPVYAFQFTTSRFAHLTHHLHSYDDAALTAELDAAVDAGVLLAEAGAAGTLPSDAEMRACDKLARGVLGAAADSQPPRFEVTRVSQGGAILGWLARTSEPLDWTRLDLAVAVAPAAPEGARVAPQALKITGVAFGGMTPREEWVSLLARETLDPSGYRLEQRTFPGPIATAIGETLYYQDFAVEGLGLLRDERFGPNALDAYAIVDFDGAGGASQWTVGGGAIAELSGAGGDADAAGLSDPGTVALIGDPDWADIRIVARLAANGDGAIGIVFRYRDPGNYYRFTCDRGRGCRRLVRCTGGVFHLLWEDAAASYLPGVAFDLAIDLFGARILVAIDGLVAADVADAALAQGRVGLYSWRNAGSRCEALRIEALETDPMLLRGGNLEAWLVLDAVGAAIPSAWATTPDGRFTQTAPTTTAGLERLGAHLVSKGAWEDARLNLDLTSMADGSCGVLLRYRDRDNYYRFSMSRRDANRRLEKNTGGVFTVLWESSDSFELGQTYRLDLSVAGRTITGAIDGAPLFSVSDGDHARGGIGLYTSDNAGAVFDRLTLRSLVRSVAGFRIIDAAGLGGSSAWRTREGELQQEALIGEAAAPRRGTHAIAPILPPPTMRLTADVRSDGAAPVGVLFRYVDEANYYRLSLSTEDHARQLIRMVGGAATTLWQSAGGYAPEVEHRIVVDTFGDRIVGYLDGETLFDLIDATLPAGQLGLYIAGNDVAAFLRVEVSVPPLEANALLADDFSAGDLSAWSFVSAATTGGTPHWQLSGGILRQTVAAFAPPEDGSAIEKRGVMALAGDATWRDVIFSLRLRSEEGAIGAVFRYQDPDNTYRFSMDHALGYRRLVKVVSGIFTVLWEDAAAYDASHAQELTIVARGERLWGYCDGLLLFAVNDAELSAGRVGLYCWRNSTAEFASIRVLPITAANEDWAFKDDFPYLVRDRWAFVDTGTSGGPSNWRVESGALVESSGIGGSEPRHGTFAVSATGARDWADVRVTTQLAASGGAVAIAARYRDPDNHYRLEFGIEGAGRKLVRVAGGVETVLWSDAQGLAKSEPVVAVLECVGTRLSAYVNAVKICEVVDGALPTGRVALFAAGATDARFSLVRVTEAAWRPIYRFPRGTLLPAGQRLRIIACTPSAAPPPLPNVRDVFAAGPGERGQLHMLEDTCELRLADANGRPQHTRSFTRPDRYAPAAAAPLLRSPDGCTLFVAANAPGEHRLSFTYRRDNRAEDPHSLVLREAGEASAEVVALDLV